jgi:hypothetical protein
MGTYPLYGLATESTMADMARAHIRTILILPGRYLDLSM